MSKGGGAQNPQDGANAFMLLYIPSLLLKTKLTNWPFRYGGSVSYSNTRI